MKVNEARLNDLWLYLQHTWPNAWRQEYRFHPKRRWRFDFAATDHMLAIEVEGLTYDGGRHQRTAGYAKDCEKYNEAVLMGWTLLRITYSMISDGTALGFIERGMARAAETKGSE